MAEIRRAVGEQDSLAGGVERADESLMPSCTVALNNDSMFRKPFPVESLASIVPPLITVRAQLPSKSGVEVSGVLRTQDHFLEEITRGFVLGPFTP
jgi:hypothetical protein